MKTQPPGRESVAGPIGCHKEGTSRPFVTERKASGRSWLSGASYEVAEL